MILQIAKIIFTLNLEIMKRTLDLGKFKLGKDKEDYKYFKREIMDYFFNNMQKLFQALYSQGILERCQCKAKLRQGYSDCPFCGGSGYKNKET